MVSGSNGLTEGIRISSVYNIMGNTQYNIMGNIQYNIMGKTPFGPNFT